MTVYDEETLARMATALRRSGHLKSCRWTRSLGGGVRLHSWEVSISGNVVQRGETTCRGSAESQIREAERRATAACVHLFVQARERRLRAGMGFEPSGPWDSDTYEQVGHPTSAGQRQVNANWHKRNYQTRVRVIPIDPCPLHPETPRVHCNCQQSVEARGQMWNSGELIGDKSE